MVRGPGSYTAPVRSDRAVEIRGGGPKKVRQVRLPKDPNAVVYRRKGVGGTAEVFHSVPTCSIRGTVRSLRLAAAKASGRRPCRYCWLVCDHGVDVDEDCTTCEAVTPCAFDPTHTEAVCTCTFEVAPEAAAFLASVVRA
jgi:hypothetical protein